MGLELIVCMLLAGVFTGGRVAQDVIATLTGNTPPHVERARLRAEREKVRAERARLKADRTSDRYTAGKPRLRDVAAVYWGDALTDVISAHDRRRAEKQAQQSEDKQAAVEQRPARKVRPSWKQRAVRLGRLLWEPVGENRDTDQPDPDADGDLDVADRVSHFWECSKCDATEGGYATQDESDAAAQRHIDSVHGGRGRMVDEFNEPPANTKPGNGRLETPGSAPAHDTAANEEEEERIDWDRERAALTETGIEMAHELGNDCLQPGCWACADRHREGQYTPLPIPDGRAFDCPRCGTPVDYFGRVHGADIPDDDRLKAHCPQCGWIPVAFSDSNAPSDTNDKEQSMTEAAAVGVPTGEAVNYETAIVELDKIEAAQQTHLEQAQQALDKVREAKAAIGDTQASYRPAAEAAGLVHQHLHVLNVDQETVAATGTIADSMPPNRVDEIFAQLEGMEADALQQVSNAEAALAATAAARASIVEKYGDANTTVQQHLAGDSRFLAASGAA
ncbi:zinc ribbon domain-containing protein [Actinoplanes sp. NPDC023936]|uniref:zinc ribbon domain-containing protein n=1 Tax=Actinoplanes sp. NPDC023936 TaxID=3154910 RepID=UPI0034026217